MLYDSHGAHIKGCYNIVAQAILQPERYLIKWLIDNVWFISILPP